MCSWRVLLNFFVVVAAGSVFFNFFFLFSFEMCSILILTRAHFERPATHS